MERLMTVEEVCQLLRIKKSTLYQWVHQKQIPCLKVGRLVRFRAEDIEKWLEKKRQDMIEVQKY